MCEKRDLTGFQNLLGLVRLGNEQVSFDLRDRDVVQN